MHIQNLPPSNHQNLPIQENHTVNATVAAISAIWKNGYDQINPAQLEAHHLELDKNKELLSSELQDFLYASKLQLDEVKASPKIKQLKSHSYQAVSSDYDLTNVLGDGNCLLRSISHYVGTSYQDLRKNLSELMKRKLAEEKQHPYNAANLRILPTLVTTENPTKEEIDKAADDYIKRISTDCEWLGDFELPFLPELFKRPIWVVRTNNLKMNEHGHNLPYHEYRYGEDQYPTAKPIIIYHNSGHYQVATPKFDLERARMGLRAREEMTQPFPRMELFAVRGSVR